MRAGSLSCISCEVCPEVARARSWDSVVRRRTVGVRASGRRSRPRGEANGSRALQHTKLQQYHMYQSSNEIESRLTARALLYVTARLKTRVTVRISYYVTTLRYPIAPRVGASGPAVGRRPFQLQVEASSSRASPLAGFPARRPAGSGSPRRAPHGRARAAGEAVRYDVN